MSDVNTALSPAEIAFFAGHMAALPLYEALRARLLELLPDTRLEVRRTQISCKNRHLFAAVSFAPVRRAALRPPVWLTLTLGLPYRLDSPRVDAAVEAYPGRWTLHCLLGDVAEIDAELLGWLQEAAAFAAAKR